MTLPQMRHRAETVVDLDAIAHNVATLRRHAGVAMMTVVKADAYGHGLVESARAARAGGADWLGVAVLEEALALRRGGDTRDGDRLRCIPVCRGEGEGRG